MPPALRADIPVIPGVPDARQWLLDELAKPEYAAARPTLFDRIAQAIRDWFASLTVPSGDGIGAFLPLIVTLVVIGLIVAAFLIVGRPRLRTRSRAQAALFGDDDLRSAAELLASAERAAAAGDFGTGVEELFRALARGLAERTVVEVSPGTTAQDFSERAGRAFPAHAARLLRAARIFDGVRYLDERGDRSAFDEIAALERELRSRTPERHDPVGTGSVS